MGNETSKTSDEPVEEKEKVMKNLRMLILLTGLLAMVAVSPVAATVFES
jgi:hypothetical protein